MSRAVSLLGVLAMLGAATLPAPQRKLEGDGLRIGWHNDILSVSSRRIPGGTVEIWYLEAFCRSGSTDRDWSETVIPHTTVKLGASADGTAIRLRTVVGPGVEALHTIGAGEDEVDFHLTITNPTTETVDVQWAQPCIRVGTFTGLKQDGYIRKCFIFTEDGYATLDKVRRTEDARYRGGQVYVPKGIGKDDVNPRPISPDVPVHGLIGCVSADGTMLLAMAWDSVQELFQGVITCIHADFRIGGLAPGETKELRGKLYLMANDPDELLARYRRDFPARNATGPS